jgi:squalene-hopene/tetraprenyl-beta-curcumene cyclase
MHRRRVGLLVPFVLVLGLAVQPSVSSHAKPAADWKGVTDQAIAFVKSTQKPDGSWGTAPQGMGVSGVIVTGLLGCGVSADEEPAAKGLKYIESLINAEAGHIAGPEPKMGLQNYVTSVNLMALTAAKRDAKYRGVVGNAAKFLRNLQWDDSEGKDEKSDFYGGAGYDSKSRPDLSNTQFFLDALKAAGTPTNDPAIRNAMIFVSRCQNLKSEFNDQPWAGSINDGSFIYSAAGGGSTKTSDEPNAPLTGYGSMTYAGVKSMIYAGITKDDVRFKNALTWIRKNYTLEANPGMPPALASRGLYYYYHTFAKTMDLLGEDEFVDAAGVKHNWRADLLAVLAKRQQPDGSWMNATDRWMEGDPNLVTGYALMALSHCKPK